MSAMLKIEVICGSCDKQFILVMKEEDKQELYCPFCTLPIEEDTPDETAKEETE